MFTGTGSQTDTNGRWGDYSYLSIDPSDGISFWHTNEYYVTNSSFNWATRVGKFQFPAGSPTPTATQLRLRQRQPLPLQQHQQRRLPRQRLQLLRHRQAGKLRLRDLVDPTPRP